MIRRTVAVVSTRTAWSDNLTPMLRRRDIVVESFRLALGPGDTVNVGLLKAAWRSANHVVTDADAAYVMLYRHRSLIGFGDLYVLDIGTAKTRATVHDLANRIRGPRGARAYVLPGGDDPGRDAWLVDRIAPDALPEGVHAV